MLPSLAASPNGCTGPCTKLEEIPAQLFYTVKRLLVKVLHPDV